MSLFYTGKGDQGISCVGDKKIPKDSPLLDLLGDLDELNSLIGVYRSELQDEDLREKLKRIQEALFIVQARTAWIMFPEHEEKKLPPVRIKELEQEIDAIEQKIQPERGFIISGEHILAAKLDYIRTVVRRIERKANVVHRTDPFPAEILTYLNRLSSYFYALARNEIFEHNIEESNPTYE
jgi:cob(I)alamin adenosyltransferase